jgi:hypothetical protein
MDLVRDVLDKQIRDADDCPAGKVDGIVAELRDREPPRVMYLEVSGIARARRMSPRLGRWAAALAGRWSPEGGEPLRIAVSRVHDVGTTVHADIDAERSPAYAWERWLRDHVIGRIPGAGPRRRGGSDAR